MSVLSRRSQVSEARRDARREATRARLMGAAEEWLEAGGTYAELPVEWITARAGLSRPSFYVYFADKRELLLALGADRFRALPEAADVVADGQSGERELTQLLRTSLMVDRRHAAILRAFTEAASYDHEIRARWRQWQLRLANAAERWLEGERAAGRLSADVPLRATARALVWMGQQTTYQELVLDTELDEEETLAALSRIWMLAARGEIADR